MNHFGQRFRHSVVSLNGDVSASDRIHEPIEVVFPKCRCARNPAAMLANLAAIMRERRPDAVFTYNWGSIEAVAAAAWERKCPVVHTEDGFGMDEVSGQKLRRVLARRFVLRFADRVVAPSRTLIRIMTEDWRVPKQKLEYIPNGIEAATFECAAAAVMRRNSSAHEVVVGTVGHLRPEKRQSLLIEICAAAQPSLSLELQLAGDGPERKALEDVAARSRLGSRVRFLGHRRDLPAVYSGFDIFALASATEQMPLSVLEAMASGLPVVSTDVGDVKEMVSPENRPFIVDGAQALSGALVALAQDPGLRTAIGAANRNRCIEQFSLDRMFDRYSAVYKLATRRN